MTNSSPAAVLARIISGEHVDSATIQRAQRAAPRPSSDDMLDAALDRIAALCDQAERDAADDGDSLPWLSVSAVRALLAELTPEPGVLTEDARPVTPPAARAGVTPREALDRIAALHSPKETENAGTICADCDLDYPCAASILAEVTPERDMPSPLTDPGDMQSSGPETYRSGGDLDQPHATRGAPA